MNVKQRCKKKLLNTKESRIITTCPTSLDNTKEESMLFVHMILIFLLTPLFHVPLFLFSGSLLCEYTQKVVQFFFSFWEGLIHTPSEEDRFAHPLLSIGKVVH